MIPVLIPLFLALAGQGAFASSGGERHNLVRCTIFGKDRKPIRTFPGQMCAFLPDGKVAISFHDRLVMKGPKGENLWRLPLRLNHQLNSDLSGKRLLTLADDDQVVGGWHFRSDTLYMLGLDGSVLGRYSLFEHHAEIEARRDPRPSGPDCLRALGNDCNLTWFPVENTTVGLAVRTAPKLTSSYLHGLLRSGGFAGDTPEYSHANSIYEIPPNAYAAVDPAFSPGGFIVNALITELVFIIDSKFERILWSRTYSDLGSRMVHDAQVLPNGHLLFFENMDRLDTDPRSNLVEYDVASGRRTVIFTGGADFFAPLMGGVQLLENGNLLYNDPTRAFASEIDRAGKIVWDHYYWSQYAPDEPRPFQQMKRDDLSPFLANNGDLASLSRVKPEVALAEAGTPPPPPSVLRVERDGDTGTAFGTNLLKGDSWKSTVSAELIGEKAGLKLMVWVGRHMVSVLSASDTQFRFKLPKELPSTGSAQVRIFYRGLLCGQGTMRLGGAG